MDTGFKSMVLNFSQKNWKRELEAAGISLLAKKNLRAALSAKLSRTGVMPDLTQEEFNSIVDQDVFFIKLGAREFLLSFRKDKLFLSEGR